MQAASQRFSSTLGSIRRSLEMAASIAWRMLGNGSRAVRTGLARLWIALAPLRAAIVRLTMTGEPPHRRLRRASFWLLAASVFGLTTLITAAMGGFVILGLDPLRNFSAPLASGTAIPFTSGPESAELWGQNDRRRAALEGLQARGEALNRPPTDLAILQDALTLHAQLNRRQMALIREKGAAARRAQESNALSVQMDGVALRAIQRFGRLLAQGLSKQIEADAALAADLRAAGWLGDLNAITRTLRLAQAPLVEIEQELGTAATPTQAAAIANRIADIGAAIARFRTPIPQAQDALQAREAFIALAAEIRSLLDQLREQASDRPWIFASAERKESWRQTVMRLETLQPYMNELDALAGQALQSTRPESVRAALLRATQIKQSVETGLTAALPAGGPQAGPSQAVIEARQRVQRQSAAAEDAYREAFERTTPRFASPPRRRRDRERLEDLREAMKRLYDLTVRISAADRAAQASTSEGAVLQAANEAAALAQTHAQTAALVMRLERELPG